ncbi:CAP-Gly domain-containing linker protein 1 [Dufourea novaeangliae]|uniref:CAP-Gly domain-containing linker protein 1 n=1 Tax=Dufourea novaeangliae TaxID=178035 RepID=A0A154PQ57_DUFNO|nr:CAP-Gly domain-containing linker protein 1 [Dufourea novaeangliae]
MGEPKPSGLRPPSKIGRPCSNLPPRPAVPPSPPRPAMTLQSGDFSWSLLRSLRALIKDLLYIVFEDSFCHSVHLFNEPIKITQSLESSGARVSLPLDPETDQMDHLWETHGRRLSEAGLRRGSDTSVVLTEDTDSFIIGDRVWVGGTKPGSIAYIGETQFAPGDWAGVVLDEPIGKNDGSVANCRYFQCEPKRGIFSRLTRLTREPLSDSSFTSPTTQRTPTSPPDSVRGSLGKTVSPSLNASTTSLSSTVSQRDLKLGERVIVSSSQGSKTGVLRYLGSTEFAAGEWCGVELDEPVGKNDGSVFDKRYFECRPRYGLFAPAHKVSRSPTSRRTSCMMHKPTGASLNSSLKRTGSRESLVSLSSIASTASTTARPGGVSTARRPGLRTATLARPILQETLREKQQEIEILRRERDLERERVTKAANQADQAEQSIISIKQEYEQYREKMQRTVTEAEIAFTKLLEEKNALTQQLEEEKRKCEDLLFRFEEESVNKDDIQVINTVNENRIKDLEKQLAEERERVAQLEQDSTKLFETEEELARLRNEVSSAAQDKHQVEELQNRNRGLEETKTSLDREVQKKTTLVEQCVAQIRELETKLNENQKESITHKESEISLKAELDRVRNDLQEKNIFMEDMKKELENSNNTLKEELQQANETIENIRQENITEKELLTSKYEKIITQQENLLKEKTQELETESKKQLETQNVALEELKAENIKQINKLSESFNEELNMKDMKIKEVSMQLEQKISETEKLMSELTAQIDLNKKKDEELSNALKKLEELSEKLKLIEEKNVVLSNQMQEYQLKAEDSFKIIQEKHKLEEDIATLMATEANSSTQLKKLNEELKVKEKELSELRSTTAAEIKELTKRYQGQIDEKSKCIDEVKADISQKSLLLSKLENDIVELKLILASKDEEIRNLKEKTSELQDALMSSKQTEHVLESKVREFENSVADLRQEMAAAQNKISQVTAQKEKLEADIANLINSSADSSEQLMKYNEDLRMKEKELDELKDKTFKSESTVKSLETKLSNMEQELNKVNTLTQEQRTELEDNKSQLQKEKRVNSQLLDKIKQFEAENSELQKIINENEQVKCNLNEKSQEALNFANELKNSREEIRNVQQQYDALQNSHKEKMSSLQKQLDDLQAELVVSQEETKALQKVKTKLEADQSANRWSIEELTEKLATEVENRTKLEFLISEKNSDLQQIQNKYLELQKTNEALIVNKETTDKDLTSNLSTMFKEIQELKEKLGDATEMIKVKEEALIQMKKEAEQTESQILKLTDTVASIKKEQTCNIEEMNKMQEALLRKENEVKGIIETKTSLADNVNALESQLKIVKEELNAKIRSLQEVEGTIKELQNTKDESVMKLQNSLESEVKFRQTELENMLQKNSELEQKRISLESLVEKQNSDLSNKEAKIKMLTAEIKALESTQTEKLNTHEQTKNEEVKLIQSKLDEISKENRHLINTKDSLEKSFKEQEQKIEILSNTMKNKEKEAEKNMQNLMEKLNRMSSESAQLRVKWTEATNQLKLTRENMKNNYDAAGGDMKQHIVDQDIDSLKLKEENETAKSQIDFLNSVIVDMQRKNEALMCKVEVLEMGVPANEADDYTQSTLEKRMAAPRMFCDICDQFDLHETEDCPRQAQDFLEPEKVTKSPKKVSVERPYCENCEMFGHDTRDCDDAETF